ncbi:MAG: ABC-three component system protein [Clostridium botulinum]|nr:ABC-three component system protein [Clostridium botulinum]
MFYYKFEAISSWYGYEYQGILAIYYTLKKINKLIDKRMSIDEIKNKVRGYSIELEYMEDFAVKFNKQYESFHQVKSGTSELKKDDVMDTYMKLLEFDFHKQKEIKGYFHVNKKNKLSPIKYKLIQCIKKDLLALKNELEDLKIKDRIDFRSGKKRSAIQILKDYMNDAKCDKYDMDKRIKCIDELMCSLDKIINYYFSSENKYKSIINQLVEYGEIFENIDDIEKQIYSEINKLHKSTIDHDFKTNNKSYQEKELCRLGCLVNKHIDDRHSGVSKDREILFKNFIEIFDEDLNNWGENIEYYEYMYRKQLYKYFNQYKIEKEENDECENCNEKCYLEKQSLVINKLSQEHFKIFLDNIHIGKRDNFFSFPSYDEIRKTIFESMCENHKIRKEENLNIGIVKNNSSYWVIANLDNRNRTFMKKLFDNNNNNINILRDADILITDDISIKELNVARQEYMNITQEELNGVVDIDGMDKENETTNDYTQIRVESVVKLRDVNEELL